MDEENNSAPEGVSTSAFGLSEDSLKAFADNSAAKPENEPSEQSTEEVPAEDEGNHQVQEDEQLPETEEEQQEEAKEDTKYRVGDEDVTIEQLKAGYLKNADYTQKTQRVAEATRQISRVASEVFEASAQNHLQQLMQSDPYLSLTDNDLANLDDQAYFEVKREIENRQNYFKDLQEKQAQAVQEVKNYLVAYNQERLMEAMPEIKDQQIARNVMQTALDIGKSVGFDEEELNEIVDYRFIVLAKRLHDAESKLQSNTKVTEQIEAKLVQPQKIALKAGSGGKTLPTQQEFKRAMKDFNSMF